MPSLDTNKVSGLWSSSFVILDSGDALKDGIGAMSDARMADFFGKMVRAGVTSRDIDYRKAYTLRFINKGVGRDLRPKN